MPELTKQQREMRAHLWDLQEIRLSLLGAIDILEWATDTIEGECKNVFNPALAILRLTSDKLCALEVDLNPGRTSSPRQPRKRTNPDKFFRDLGVEPPTPQPPEE
jgi:hypothetical protein